MTIDYSDLTEYADAMRSFDMVVAAEMRRAVGAAMTAYETHTVQRTPRFMGTLASSIGYVVDGTGANLRAALTTPLNYGKVVELGRRPNRRPPPSGAIELWVRRKLGLSGKEAETAAYLIARSIGRRGTKGAKMFEKGFTAATPAAQRAFDNALTRIAKVLA